MALHAYRAMDANGRIVRGRLEAGNLPDLEARVRKLGLDFIGGKPLNGPLAALDSRISRRELTQFCFHLEHLTRAGIPLIESLTDLRDSLGHARLREIVAAMIEGIQGGQTLYQAMKQHPDVFDAVFTSLIHAGELSGQLPTALGNLHDALKWQDDMAVQTRRLALYPAFLGIVVGAVFLFMMLYLVPRMVGFIQSMGQAPPLGTRLLIATSAVIVDYWPVLLALPPLVVLAMAIVLPRAPRLRRRIDRIKLSVPILGTVLSKIILARFTRVFAMLYAAGIPILEALHAMEHLAGNAFIGEGLARATGMIAEGRSVSGAFQASGLFPPLVIRMTRVGESTGELDKALSYVSDFYSRDAQASIERLQVMIEPALTLAIGLLLGWVMLAVLGPIYDTIAGIRL